MGEERPTESHEQVVDTLLDLQRRLRGERDPEPEARAPAAPPTRARAGLAERPSLPPDGVEVRAADDLRVAAAPRDEPGPAAGAAGLEERLARLERDLDALLAGIRELGGPGA